MYVHDQISFDDSILPIGSAERKPPDDGTTYKIRDTVSECAKMLSLSEDMRREEKPCFCLSNTGCDVRWSVTFFTVLKR